MLHHVEFDHFHIFKFFTFQSILNFWKEESHTGPCVWSMGVDTFVECGVPLKIAAQVELNAKVDHGTNLTDTHIMLKSR
jgi:hypothetical protein